MHLRYAHRYSLHCPIAISVNSKPTRVTRRVGAITARIPNPFHPSLAHVLSAGSLYRVRRFGGDAPAFTVCAEIGFRYDNVRLGDTISFASCCELLLQLVGSKQFQFGMRNAALVLIRRVGANRDVLTATHATYQLRTRIT